MASKVKTKKKVRYISIETHENGYELFGSDYPGSSGQRWVFESMASLQKWMNENMEIFLEAVSEVPCGGSDE